MSFATRNNKAVNVFTVETEGWNDYYSLEDLYKEDAEKVYPVRGFYINRKSKFGPRPTLISDGFFVNLPEHMLETTENIIANKEDVADINDGKVAFKIRTYISKTYNKECYGVEFVDVE